MKKYTSTVALIFILSAIVINAMEEGMVRRQPALEMRKNESSPPPALTMEKDPSAEKSCVRKCFDGDYCDSCLAKWVEVASRFEQELPPSDHDEQYFCGFNCARCHDGIDACMGEASNWAVRNTPYLALVALESYLLPNSFTSTTQKLIALTSITSDCIGLWQVNKKMLELKKRREEERKKDR